MTPVLILYQFKPLQCDSVLRIEAFGLEHGAVRRGNIPQRSVGQDAVDVHQKHLNTRCNCKYFLRVLDCQLTFIAG